MKTSRALLLAIPAACLMAITVSHAAPVESVESGPASAAYQKIDAFVSQDVVANHLAGMGLTRQQVTARLAQLSETQLENLATQVDLIQAGGTMEGAGVHKYNPLHCLWTPFVRLFNNLYQLFFCWGDIK